MNKKPLRVGLDLDGVILYNPTRIARPMVAFLKKLFRVGKHTKFYIPRSPFEKFVWNLLHRSSLFVAPGLDEIRQLVKEKKIEAYIVTARYNFLQKDLDEWLKKIEAEKYFTKVYANTKNEQPHLFKERLLRNLKLDVFIEDNWDIVNHLRSELKIFWIYNIFDRKIEHTYKFNDLNHATKFLREHIDGSKKKVLLVSDYFYPHWTGIAKCMLDWTQSLKDQIDFQVLTVAYDKKLKKEEVFKDIPIHRASYLFSLSRAKYSLSLIFKSFSLIKKADTVLINSPCSNILPISFIAKLYGKKLVIFHQGDLILPKGLGNRVIEKIFDVSTKISYALASGVATYTEDYAKHSRVLKPFLNKFTPLLPPIVPSSWKERKRLIGSQKDSIASLQNDKRQGKIIFGFAGRFVQEKGFDILFAAIPEIVKKIPNAHFVFAGETNMQYEHTFEKLKNQMTKVKDHLTILGLLKDAELKEFYNKIDFILIPSRSDCFPIVQCEAMLAGTPSIVADIPGARYLVKHSDFGVIFKKENPSDLAAKTVFAVRNKKKLLKNYSKLKELLQLKRNASRIAEYLV